MDAPACEAPGDDRGALASTENTGHVGSILATTGPPDHRLHRRMERRLDDVALLARCSRADLESANRVIGLLYGPGVILEGLVRNDIDAARIIDRLVSIIMDREADGRTVCHAVRLLDQFVRDALALRGLIRELHVSIPLGVPGGTASFGAASTAADPDAQLLTSLVAESQKNQNLDENLKGRYLPHDRIEDEPVGGFAREPSDPRYFDPFKASLTDDDADRSSDPLADTTPYDDGPGH